MKPLSLLLILLVGILFIGTIGHVVYVFDTRSAPREMALLAGEPLPMAPKVVRRKESANSRRWAWVEGIKAWGETALNRGAECLDSLTEHSKMALSKASEQLRDLQMEDTSAAHRSVVTAKAKPKEVKTIESSRRNSVPQPTRIVQFQTSSQSVVKPHSNPPPRVSQAPQRIVFVSPRTENHQFTHPMLRPPHPHPYTEQNVVLHVPLHSGSVGVVRRLPPAR